ncbi:cellulose synthase subunit BcsC-related outer membrane protein [Pseudomonas farris]
MQKIAGWALLLGGLCGPVLAQSAGPVDQQQRFLEQMRIGEALYREDLVRDALARLNLIAPDLPQVLVAGIRQALLQQDQPQAERLLERLRQQAPGSAELLQARNLWTLQSVDGQRGLRQARILAEAGKAQEAVGAYRQLFGDAPPDLASALEYWRARGGVAGQRATAIEQLRVLDRQYPGNVGLQLVLANLLFAQKKDPEGLAILHRLASNPLASNDAAEQEYSYLSRLPISPASVQGWQGFLARYPDSPLKGEASGQLQHQQQTLADPARQAAAKRRRALKTVDHYSIWLRQGDQALQRKDLTTAGKAYRQARKVNPHDARALIGLSGVAQANSDDRAAEALLLQAHRLQPDNLAVVWALVHLYQAQSVEKLEAFLDTLPADQQHEFLALRQSLRLARLNALADAATQRSDWAQVSRLLLEARPLDADNPWLAYRLAKAQRAAGQTDAADDSLRQLLQRQAGNPEARYAQALYLSANGRDSEALHALMQIPRPAWSQPMQDLAEELQRRESLARANALRDDARLIARQQPRLALDQYARGMAEAGLLTPDQANPRDDRALTLASRKKDTDDWMPRSLREEVDALYQQQNPTLHLYHDIAWRTDNTTPGTSDLLAQTSILRIDAPIAEGQGFVQVEDIDLDAGRFDTDADGLHRERFGTCAIRLRNRTTGALVSNGCQSDTQRARGSTLAIGWHDERWALDVGHSAEGFPVSNWLGGVSFANDWHTLDWKLTASRRPVSDSLLSHAGTVDPISGVRWGGVTANGLSLDLSHATSAVDGFWGSLGAHWLRGENVADNRRRLAMGGYYYNLIERADERLSTGLTLMYWGYDKDLSEFTLGQGGYYSPQRYYSVGVPLNYAWRNADWSVRLEGSLGWAYAKTDASELYPLEGAAENWLGRVEQAGLIADDVNQIKRAGTSSGANVHLQGLVERRLSEHLVLGGGLAWQHSEDYAPSRALLYLRYTFDPWQGNLPLPVALLSPYAQMR